MPLRVLQLSDTHFSGESGDLYGRDPERCLALVLQDVERRGLTADVVVVTGDLVHSGAATGYERLGTVLSGLGVPVYCLAGNHDRAVPLQANLPRPGVHVERSARIGEWLFVFLDSNAAGTLTAASGRVVDRDDRFMSAVAGAVSEADLEWLDEVLAAATAPHVFVWMHHPLFGPAGHTGLARPEFLDPVFAVLDRYPQVRGIAAGHVHSGDESARQGIRLFAAPSTWLAMDFHQMTMAPPGYRWFELADTGEVRSFAYHIDTDFVERTELPEWAISTIAGDFDSHRFEGLPQDEVIAQLGH